jgi:hypothetical protein
LRVTTAGHFLGCAPKGIGVTWLDRYYSLTWSIRVKLIYKITYPNGKIYVGMDLTGTFRYFGSPDSKTLEADFTPEQRRDFTIRREIIWDSETATDSEVRAKEVEYINALGSNDPAIGYNKWPKRR